LARRAWPSPWLGRHWKEQAQCADGSFRFLNQSRPGDFPGLWRDTSQSRLWLYHLHYLDDLSASDSQPRPIGGIDLLLSWIRDNPPFAGVGWEPFPLSLRIVNIAKFLTSSNTEPPSQVLESFALQAAALEVRIEYHLRANHLFENGKGLLFAGALLEGRDADRWLNRGLKIVDHECREQFLADGAHFELSPMYHGTMLWNLCDLIALADATELRSLLDRRPEWSATLASGLRWYRAMTHPDEKIALFNDAAFGQSPNACAVEQYATALGVSLPMPMCPESWPAFSHLQASGYIRIEPGPGHAAILDVARVGPDYQPGHAHADTLSFELSLFGERVIVNSGTSTYERGLQRDHERGTGAHNTVIVNDANSSDTWAGFRVGRRANPKLASVQNFPGETRICAEHDGYRRVFGGVTHQREWICAARSMKVIDRLVGRFSRARAHFYLHPALQLIQHADSRVQIELRGGHTVTIEAKAGWLELLDSEWHPEFGSHIPNKCVRVSFESRSIETSITW